MHPPRAVSFTGSPGWDAHHGHGDLLEGLAATDGFHGHLGLELRAVSSSLAHCWEAPGGDGAPPRRLTMGPVQKNQTTSEDLGRAVTKSVGCIQTANQVWH